ncbi:hypothetical protein SLS57_003777 [Botryosphaeria dothidea]
MAEPINPIPSKYLDKLDPQFIEVYNKHAANRLRADQVSIEEFRADPAKYTATVPRGPTLPVGSATIHQIPVKEPLGEIEVQVYVPTDDAIQTGGLKNADGKLPAYVNFHGGGWVIGSLLTDEPFCRQACQALGAIVVDVNYRHGPETPFPAAIHDALAALTWVFANAASLAIDPTRVAVGGLSAGGHLSAVLAHLVVQEKLGFPPLRLQCLVVPCVDMRWTPPGTGTCEGKTELPYRSYVELEDVPCLPLHRMRWFFDLWVGLGGEFRDSKGV